jgi:hypothetical protein
VPGELCGSANILEAGVEQRGPQSEAGDCPCHACDFRAMHEITIFVRFD